MLWSFVKFYFQIWGEGYWIILEAIQNSKKKTSKQNIPSVFAGRQLNYLYTE